MTVSRENSKKQFTNPRLANASPKEPVVVSTHRWFDRFRVCVLGFLLRFPGALRPSGAFSYHGARGVDGWVLLNETVVNPVRSERKQP